MVPQREKGDELQVLVRRRRSRIGRIMNFQGDWSLRKLHKKEKEWRERNGMIGHFENWRERNGAGVAWEE